MLPDAERLALDANGPDKPLRLPGPGAIHAAVRVADRGLPFRANCQPVGLRSVLPSTRMVQQRCRIRSSSASTICFCPRKSYHCA